jgi:hypothetical protein
MSEDKASELLEEQLEAQTAQPASSTDSMSSQSSSSGQRISSKRTERVEGTGEHWIGDEGNERQMTPAERRKSFRERARRGGKKADNKPPPPELHDDSSPSAEDIRFGARRRPDERGSQRQRRKRQKSSRGLTNSGYREEVHSQSSQGFLLEMMEPSSSTNPSDIVKGGRVDDWKRYVFGACVFFFVVFGFWFWVF